MNLIKQAKIARDSAQHNTDTQERMEHVEKQWILPTPSANIPPIANPYATNILIYNPAITPPTYRARPAGDRGQTGPHPFGK